MALMKRVFDCTAAAVGIFALLPAFLIIAILIRVKLGTPVLFSQLRPGLHGHPFRMWKFRSMTNERDSHGELLPDDLRLPPFGRMLRSTSLDELPELWNVLTGEMSLVGPRPLLMEYLPRYSDHQARRHEVRPGITGWAQINGRNGLDWSEKFDLDVWYVDNRSFLLDLKIIAMTVAVIFRRDGISHAGTATMPPFLGDYPTDQTVKDNNRHDQQ